MDSRGTDQFCSLRLWRNGSIRYSGYCWLTLRGGCCKGGFREHMRLGCCPVQLAVLLSTIQITLGWHAFIGQEATPTISDTALWSGLALPVLTKSAGENGMDECQMAETSFRRVLMACNTTCTAECAVSWNSAIRDSFAAIDSGCQTLETLVNRTFLFSVSVTPPFILEEWHTLQERCVQRCGSFGGVFGMQHACQVDSTYDLAPPDSVCPSFKVTNGFFDYRVLTWETMKYYQEEDLGCVGGLGVLGGGEHSSWACLHENSCEALRQSDDLACYKYSHLRGEFHFWGLNSELDLVPPLFRIQATFCEADGTPALRDARNATIVSILTTEYKMTRFNGDNATDDMVQGMGRDLGNWGCGSFQLRKNAKYWLELSADGYYTWTGWFYTHDSESKIVVSRSLYPILDDACGIGISLDWCSDAARNLDLYMFLPLNGTGEVQSGNAHLVHWKNESYEPIPGSYIRVEQNDIGRSMTHGPDSHYMVGTLPIGTYAVVVHAETRHTTLSGLCPTLSLSAGATEGGHVTSVTVGSEGAKGSWWYALNLHVEPQSSQAILFSYSVVDQVINPGPDMDAGMLRGSFPVPLSQVPAGEKREMFSLLKSRRECGIFGILGVAVFDARTGLQLPGATITLDDDATVYDVDSNLVSHDGQGTYSGGLSYFEGEHAVSVSVAGYVPRVKTVNVIKGNVPTYAEMFMVPADNRTHMVLTWGNAPADLDLVVIPRGVANFDKRPLDWTGPDGQPVRGRGPCQEPHLWNGVVSGNDTECRCVVVEGGCEPTCFISAGLQTAYVPRVSLDREEAAHGGVGDNGFASNKPETLTFEKLMAGSYDVYASARVQGSMVGTVALDVYLGDGLSSIAFMAAEEVAASGQSWVRFGTLQVRPTSRGCEGVSASQAPQDGMVTILCYTWEHDLHPLSTDPIRDVDRAGLDLRDASTDAAVSRGVVTVDGFDFLTAPTGLVSVVGGGLSGGFLFFEESVVSVSAPGYVTTSVRLAFQTCRADSYNLAVFMVPADGMTRVVVKWDDAPADLDVYVLPRGVQNLAGSFVSWSSAEGGQPATWSTNEDSYGWYQEPAITAGSDGFSTRVALERSDAAHGTTDATLGRPDNGPETVSFRQLLPGEYEVYVNANPPDESRSNRTALQVFGQRFTVEVYFGDGVSSTEQVDAVVVSAAGGVWRFVGYIRVSVRSGPECSGASRLQSPIAGTEVCYQWLRVNEHVQYPLQGVGLVRALVRSAVPAIPLGRVAMAVDGQTRLFGVSDWGLDSNGLFLPQGLRDITVSAEGFRAQSVQRQLGSYTVSTVTLIFFLVPVSDGLTRIVLRWGDTPMDLDVYTVPRRTRDLGGQAVEWTRSEGVELPPSTWLEGEPPYAWWDETSIAGLVSGSYVPRITLDRDDVEHGEEDVDAGVVVNGPETVSLERLLPGDYEVFVNAYPPDGEREPSEVFDGAIEIDVLLGNGADSAQLRDTVAWTAPGEVWRFVGYISVYVPESGPCEGVSQEQAALVDGNRLCYQWIRANQPVLYPLGAPPLIRVRVRDAVTDMALPDATFTVDGDEDTVYTAQDMDAGLSVIPGQYTVTAMVAGYLTQTMRVEASSQHGHTAYLVPADGRTRIVVSWSEAPADLDVYVIPTDVTTCNGEEAEWVADGYYTPETFQDGEAPYVWYGEPALIVNDGRNVSDFEVDVTVIINITNITTIVFEENSTTYVENVTYTYTYDDNGAVTVVENQTSYEYEYEYVDNQTNVTISYNVTNVTMPMSRRRLLQLNVTSNSSTVTTSAAQTTATATATPVPSFGRMCNNRDSRANTTDFFTRIRLDRDSDAHSGDAGSEGFLLNDPEVVTFDDLLPGRYVVHVSAWPPVDPRDAGQTFVGPVTIGVYLGNGVNSTRLIASVQFDAPGSVWRYVGWLEVEGVGGACESFASVRQSKAGPGFGFCYTWYTTSSNVQYPL